MVQEELNALRSRKAALCDRLVESAGDDYIAVAIEVRRRGPTCDIAFRDIIAECF